MNVAEFVALARRRWSAIVAGAVCGLLLGLGAYLTMPKTYASQALLYVTTVGAEDAGSLAAGTTFVQSQIRSYEPLVTAPSVLRRADELAHTGAPESLAVKVNATVPQDSTLMSITTTGEDPAQAARLASAFAQATSEEIVRLETRPGIKRSPVRVELVDQPVQPASPSGPSPLPIVGGGLAGGLLLGTLLAFVLDRSSRSGTV